MTIRATRPKININEQLNQLKHTTGVAGLDLLAAETPIQQFDMIGAGRRNLLINGNFQVNQQDEINSTPIAGGVFDNSCFIDRWQLDANNVPDLKISLDYDDTLKSRYIKIHNDGPQPAGTGALQLFQHVEKCYSFRGKVMTFSALVKSNTRFKLQLFDGVGYSDSNDATSVHSGGGSWELLVGRFNIPDVYQVDQRHLQARLTRYINSSWQVLADEYIYLAQAQLEIGGTRTPFEFRSYDQEIALCQRYFQRINSWNVTPMWSYTHNHASTHMKPTTTMRKCPWFPGNIGTNVLVNATGGVDTTYASGHRTRLHGVHAAYSTTESYDPRIYVWNSNADEMRLFVSPEDRGLMPNGSKFSLNFRDDSLGEFRYDFERVSGNSHDLGMVKGGTIGAYSHGLGAGINGHDQVVNPAYITLDAEIYHYNSL